MNKQKQALFILIFAFFGWAGVSAQPALEDVIYLSNGSIIRGKLLQNQNDTVKIETFGRNIFVYPKSEIYALVKELIPVSKNENIKKLVPDLQKGLYSYSTIGMLIGYSKSEDEQTYSFHTSIGYQFNNYAGLGLGVGIERMATEIVPFYASFKSVLSKKENSPFLYFYLGYSVPLSKNKDNNHDYSQTNYTYEGGMNIGFDFGIHSFKTLDRAFVITAGYRYQFVKETTKNSYYQNSTTTYNYEFNRIAVKIGFMFM